MQEYCAQMGGTVQHSLSNLLSIWITRIYTYILQCIRGYGTWKACSFCNLKEYKSIFNYIPPKCDFSLGFFMIINTKASPSSPPKKGKSHSHNTKNSYNLRIDPKGHDLTRPSRISHTTITIRTQGVTACSYRAVYHAGRPLRVSANTHEYNHSNQIIKTSKLSKPNTNRHNPSSNRHIHGYPFNIFIKTFKTHSITTQ